MPMILRDWVDTAVGADRRDPRAPRDLEKIIREGSD